MLRVLIIKLSAFGDIIHSLSVMECFEEYFKKYNREVELHWLIEKRWSPILAHHPAIHNIILTNTKAWRREPFSRSTRQEISECWSRLRKDRFDLVLDINGLLRSAALARIARARLRVGFSKDSGVIREKQSVYLLDKCFSVPRGHVVDQTTRLLEQALEIEMAGPVHPYLPVNDAADRRARELLAEKDLTPNRFAVIAAGGGWQTKLLDEGLIAGFCKCVRACGIEPVLSWAGDVERERAERIFTLTEGGVRDLGEIPIDVFMEVLRLSRLVIGPDTGTVHAGSAVGTPTVSYYGPSSAKYSGPRRLTDRVVQLSPSCGPCFRRTCSETLCNYLKIDKVLDAIRELL